MQKACDTRYWSWHSNNSSNKLGLFVYKHNETISFTCWIAKLEYLNMKMLR